MGLAVEHDIVTGVQSAVFTLIVKGWDMKKNIYSNNIKNIIKS